MDKERYTVIVGEEVGTKVRSFLIAPEFTSVRVGDLVVAKGLQFRTLYVDSYCSEDGTEMTVLRVALGHPYKVTSIITEEQIKWEEDSENDDVDG